MSAAAPVQPPTQILKQMRIPNYTELQTVLESLIALQLKFTVSCFEYNGADSAYPRFTVTIYVQ